VRRLTSSENEKIALNFIEAFNRQDKDAYVDHLTDDADVWWAVGERTPTKEEIGTEFIEIIEALPDRRFDLVRMLSTEDSVIAECVFKGTNRGELFGMPATNNSLELPIVHLWDFEDGKVKRWRSYANAQTINRQLRGE